MKEQTYQIENQTSFEPRHIFECGQCFRWNLQLDGSYIGVFGNNVMQVRKKENAVYFEGMCEGDIQSTVEKYFDLNRNYETIKEKLSKVDNSLKKSIEYGQGIRMLNQDLWETILSFIISANNNIPRIKGIIERLSQSYGKPIIWRGKTYYTFPTPEELKEVSIEQYRKLGLGFRDQRVYETTKMVLSQEIRLEEMEQMETKMVKEKLLSLSGVGPKVADCILLFSTLKRIEVFPIDVWVRRVMNELYIHHIQENKVKPKEVEVLAQDKFGNLAGIAQQYLFYWKREDGA